MISDSVFVIREQLIYFVYKWSIIAVDPSQIVRVSGRASERKEAYGSIIAKLF